MPSVSVARDAAERGVTASVVGSTSSELVRS